MTPWRPAFVILLAATAAGAHEGGGPNGGRIADAGNYHVELVTKGDTVDLFLSDGSQKPVSASGFKGTAILVIDGKPARIALEPAGGSRLSGRAAATLPAAPKGAVRLTAPNGATASGRFD